MGEEILNAMDKELNMWAPLKKVVSVRSEADDIKDRDYFRRQKEKNTHRYNRVFKSLVEFKAAKDNSSASDQEETKDDHSDKNKEKKRRKQKVTKKRLTAYGIDNPDEFRKNLAKHKAKKLK